MYIYMYMSMYMYMFISMYMKIYMYICINVYMYMFAENRTYGKTETANFHWYAGNGNGKRKFVFLGRQMINGNRRLLFQQTCLPICGCK
jgi:hypothetical protein